MPMEIIVGDQPQHQNITENSVIHQDVDLTGNPTVPTKIRYFSHHGRDWKIVKGRHLSTAQKQNMS